MTKWIQFITLFLIIIILITGLCLLFHRLSYQLVYLHASNQIYEKQYNQAVKTLEKAVRFHPSDNGIWRTLGEAYYKMGSSKPFEKKFEYTHKSLEAYQQAAALNPIDASAVYGLARAEARLERLYPLIHNNVNPYNALPCFYQAVKLRPNSISYRYSLIRHLYYTGRQDTLLSAVTDMAAIVPAIHNQLRTETFWSVDVKNAVKKGIQQAITNNTNQETAYSEMSRLLSEENDWRNALNYYEKYFALQGHNKTPNQSLKLGELLLRTGRFKEAEKRFIDAMKVSPKGEYIFQRILNIYLETNNTEALFKIFKKAGERSLLPAEANSILGKTLFRFHQYDPAEKILSNLNENDVSAETYYWLARIAQKKQNWRTMELTARQAVSMDEKNSEYHFLLSQILSKNKKFLEAERELDLAIQYAEKPSHILFIHRASVRSQKGNFQGAAADWEKVISLHPKAARYYAHAANAYEQLGKRASALEYYRKAMTLDPNNKNYQKKYQELKNRY